MAWLGFLLLLAADRIGPVVLFALAPLGLGWAGAVGGGADWAAAALGAVEATGGWLGLAVGLGCLVHIAGDMLTISGCPLLWPVPLGGRRWRELTTPRTVSFRTGGAVERYVVAPVCVVALLGVGLTLVPL